MIVAFFLREADRSCGPPRGLPDGLTMQVWRPRGRGTRSALTADALRLGVTIQDKLGLFDDDRYTEFSLWCATTRVHRLIVTPRWHRFPFMARGDLQLGGLWTHPGWRRRGLARSAVAEAHSLFDAPGQRYWYVADTSNAASMALARAAGYRIVGQGRRTRPMGLAILGQFRLEREHAAA